MAPDFSKAPRGAHYDRAKNGIRTFEVSDSEDRARDQAWFWTPEWQEGERQADADIAAGRTQLFETVEDLIAWLDAEPA